MRTIKVYFGDCSTSLSDGQVESEIAYLLKVANHDDCATFSFFFSNYIVLLGLRANLYVRPELQEVFKFFHHDKEITFDKNMRFTGYIPPLYELPEKFLSMLLT